ncbi:tetratricopeptide repeat protein [Acuticoccus mangrovi]|uniref:Bacterial transcriptional activator domain-containing protein n=1 Tax=Acuticoccus mangrovi TaxID=2796142 RepID=A0A934ITG3_9HYPH|nr:hypothetical protein [Acuticoccus mangrovi]MBJ3778430.1 hypothetical protein [Acuticoccus mangrovi]
MADVRSAGRLTISLFGAFRVRGPDGSDLTPTRQKSRAVLAIIALSPELGRSRTALQDKLWSLMGPEHSAANLRQALTDIRRSLGDYQDCLLAEPRYISLDPERVAVAVDPPAGEGAAAAAMLLDDLTIRDPEFEDWLREQRAKVHDRLDAGSARSTGPAERIDRPATGASFVGWQPAPRLGHGKAPEVERPWVRVLPPELTRGDNDAFLSRVVGDAVAGGLAELNSIEVRDTPLETPGIEIRVEAQAMAKVTAVHLTYTCPHTTRRLWSGTGLVPNDGFIVDADELKRLINEGISVGSIQLRNLYSADDRRTAFAMGYDAIQRMCTLDYDDLQEARRLLDTAFAMEGRGIFLAWRAYAQTYDYVEHNPANRQVLREEAKAYARQAIELEPHNSMVHALTSYVYSLVLDEYHVAHELAERSLALSRHNALAMAFLGRVKSHLGDHQRGYSYAAAARKLAGPTPYQPTLDLICGLTALESGQYDEALRIGELMRALWPRYLSPQRYLVPLYMRAGEKEKARDMLEHLRKVDPSFSLAALRDAYYPNAAIRASGLLNYSEEIL